MITANRTRQSTEEARERDIVNRINTKVNEGEFFLMCDKNDIDQIIRTKLLEYGYFIEEKAGMCKISW